MRLSRTFVAPAVNDWASFALSVPAVNDWAMIHRRVESQRVEGILWIQALLNFTQYNLYYTNYLERLVCKVDSEAM